jgi:hypothetical protein
MPIDTETRTKADGVVRREQVYVTTSAATATALTFTFGFEPKRVVLHNLTDRISDEWFSGMAAASSLHSVAVGTRTLETTNGVTVSGGDVTFTAVTMAASKAFALLVEG